MKLLPRKPIPADTNVSRGIEFALGIAVFLGVGYLLDRWLGTEPVFMIVLFLVGVIGEFAALWYRYTATMSAHDAERLSARHSHQAVDARRGAP